MDSIGVFFDSFKTFLRFFVKMPFYSYAMPFLSIKKAGLNTLLIKYR